MQGVDCCTYHLILQISTKLKNAGLGSKVEFVNFLIGVIACEMQSRMFYVLCPNRLGGCYSYAANYIELHRRYSLDVAVGIAFW